MYDSYKVRMVVSVDDDHVAFRHFLMLLQVFSHLYCILQVLYRKQQSQKAATALSRPKTAPRFWWSLALHTPLKSTSFIALERAWKMLHFTPRKCVGIWSVLWNIWQFKDFGKSVAPTWHALWLRWKQTFEAQKFIIHSLYSKLENETLLAFVSRV